MSFKKTCALILLHTSFTLSIEQPQFAYPVNLFEERDLGKEMRKKSLSLYERFIAMVCSMPRARQLIHQASSDKTMREIGHQKERLVAYSGAFSQPNRIIITQSGKPTLQETINSFFKAQVRLAHNFFIDRDGKIHPVTKEDESIQDALKHRPFAVGNACHVDDDGSQERDLNAHGITISLIGSGTQETTAEQTASLIELVKWLSEQYNITPDHVVDYGVVAYPYGRRHADLNLPWQELDQAGLALHPKVDQDASFQPRQQHMPQQEFNVLWASAALQRLGYICPNTTNGQHPSFQQALQLFQRHHQCDRTDGSVTLQTLATIRAMLQAKDRVKPNDSRWPRANK